MIEVVKKCEDTLKDFSLSVEQEILDLKISLKANLTKSILMYVNSSKAIATKNKLVWHEIAKNLGNSEEDLNYRYLKLEEYYRNFQNSIHPQGNEKEENKS